MVNHNEYQQITVPPIPQVNNNQQQQEILEQNTAITSTNQVLLKDLNFIDKSQHALQSLLLLIIQQICLFFGIFQVFTLLEHSSVDGNPYYLFLYVPLYVTFLFLSNLNYFRKFIFSLLLFFIHILLTSIVLFYFCALFSKQRKEDGFSATDYDNATLCCILIIPLNTIEIIFIMIYLCIESKKLQFIIILPLLCVIYGFLIVLQILTLYNTAAFIIIWNFVVECNQPIIQRKIQFEKRANTQHSQLLQLWNHYTTSNLFLNYKYFMCIQFSIREKQFQL